MSSIIELVNRISSEAWTAIGVSLIAFFGVWFTNRNNRNSLKLQLQHDEKLEARRICKERLEELYSLVTQWRRERNDSYLNISYLITGQATPTDYLDYVNSPKFNVHESRMEMLVSIYAESSLDTYTSAIDLSLKIHHIEDKYIQSLPSPEPRIELQPVLLDLQSQFVRVATALQTEIVKAAKEV